MSIFKAYDIRGLSPEQLDPPLARAIGRAFGQFLTKGPVAVAHDMRTTGPDLHAALTEGLLDCGLDVVDLGLCSTPMLNFGVASRGLAGGVMITASHNPGKYNGMKLCREQGIPIAGDTGLADIERLALAELGKSGGPTRGSVTKAEPFESYRALLKAFTKPVPRTLKLVVDCGNGMAGAYEFRILSELFPGTIGMYVEPDGAFPNHEANPLVEKNLDDLRHRVVEEKADAGIAFDGDGDRVAFVDETGRTVAGDLLLALMVPEALAREPGAAVLYDLRSSWAVKEEIERGGGRAVLSRVGHSFIKKTMRETQAILGGEVSGHYYFRDFYYLDSGIHAALKILELLGNSRGRLSELAAPLDRYPRTGEVNFVVDDAKAALARVEAAFAGQGTQTRLDGLSVELADWWFNLRLSNTEPLVRLNAQARSEERLAAEVAKLRALIGGQEH